MDIVAEEQLKACIDPPTTDEHAAFERSLLAESCRDAPVLQGNSLVDGHKRRGTPVRNGAQPALHVDGRREPVDDRTASGQRSASDCQRGILALRKREILARRRHGARPDEARGQTPAPDDDTPPQDETARSAAPTSRAKPGSAPIRSA